MKTEMCERGIYYEGRYIGRQDDALENYIYCPDCKKPLYKTDTPGSYARCYSCKKDHFLIDTLHEVYESSVAVGRPPNGILLNAGMGIDYLLDNDNNIVLFRDVADAVDFLNRLRVDKSQLSLFYYIDSAMQAELDNETAENEEE